MITYHDEQHEVNPIPERMSVLDVIHNVHPSFQAYDLEKSRWKIKLYVGFFFSFGIKVGGNFKDNKTINKRCGYG